MIVSNGIGSVEVVFFIVIIGSFFSFFSELGLETGFEADSLSKLFVFEFDELVEPEAARFFSIGLLSYEGDSDISSFQFSSIISSFLSISFSFYLFTFYFIS